MYLYLSVFDQDKCLFSCYYYTDGWHWLLNWNYANTYFDSESYRFYIEIKKGFLLSSVHKHLKGIFEYRARDCRKPVARKQFLKNKPVKEWIKKFIGLLRKKNAWNEWMNEYERENDDSDVLGALYSTYQKLGQFFFHTYSLTCVKKDSSVLLKVINIWTS